MAVGPLSRAESRKLLLRLPSLEAVDASSLAQVLRVLGGHPRVLEFLDALLRGGKGRFSHVTRKLAQVLASHDLAGTTGVEGLEEGIQAALAASGRDIFLEELVGFARAKGIEEVLLQVAVSNLPVTPAGAARLLGRDPGLPEGEAAMRRALAELEDLALLHRFPDGSAWVHRWTAEGLAQREPAQHRARCIRAGRYRMWRAKHESHALEDLVEAVRNFLAGEEFDAATKAARVCFEVHRRDRQSAALAALASEVLEKLPETHGSYAVVADEEAQAHLSLGQTGKALRRTAALLARHEELVRTDPDRADYQRDLSVSYSKMGDLYRALGQWEQARESYQQSLAIAERLAQSEPDRADYQRDLSVSCERMGDLYVALGQWEQARKSYQQSLAIRERLAQSEPDRADYQRDLSVSYERMGDLYRALGQGEQARESYQQSLAIAERLARSEPDRADYQRDLSVSYIKMGDLYRALGQGEQARESYQQSLAIAERLAQSEPDRADYQRDLSVSYGRMGDLYRALGQGKQARESYQQSLAIAERLAQSEPDRADYQRDLVVSLVKTGEVDPAQAAACWSRALEIVTALDKTGRLDPADEWLIADLQQRLRSLRR